MFPVSTYNLAKEQDVLFKKIKIVIIGTVPSGMEHGGGNAFISRGRDRSHLFFFKSDF